MKCDAVHKINSPRSGVDELCDGARRVRRRGGGGVDRVRLRAVPIAVLSNSYEDKADVCDEHTRTLGKRKKRKENQK